MQAPAARITSGTDTAAMPRSNRPTPRPRVLVVANDARAGAELARDLSNYGTTPAVTSEVEAAKAIPAVEPSLLVWVTARIDPAKLASVIRLAGPATVVVVSDDPAGRACLPQLPHERLHLTGTGETSGALLARLVGLAREAAGNPSAPQAEPAASPDEDRPTLSEAIPSPSHGAGTDALHGAADPAKSEAPALPRAPSPATLAATPPRPERRRSGTRLLLLGVTGSLLATTGVIAASRTGVIALPAVDVFVDRVRSLTAPEPTPAPAGDEAAAAAAPSAEAAASGSAETSPSAAAEPSGSSPSVPPGPDAVFAESVRPAPGLEELLASRGAIPRLSGASVRQLLAYAEDASRFGTAEDALHFIALARQRDPTSATARAAHVRTLLLFGDAPAAATHAESYLAETPGPLLQELYGDALAASGRFEAARSAWLPEPRSPAKLAAARSLSLNGGRERAKKGQTKEAKRWFRRAAVLDMENFEALVALTGLLIAEGEASSAVAWAEQACRVAPEVGASHALHGRALLLRGDRTNALAALERAVKYNPSDRDSMRQIIALRGDEAP